MTKATHTPGQWILDHLSEAEYLDAYTSFFQIRRGLNTVAFVPQTTNADEQEANARLIAAAPELLEALEQAAAAYELLIVSTLGFTPEERSAMEKDLALFEAAIRKARGEQC